MYSKYRDSVVTTKKKNNIFKGKNKEHKQMCALMTAQMHSKVMPKRHETAKENVFATVKQMKCMCTTLSFGQPVSFYVQA